MTKIMMKSKYCPKGIDVSHTTLETIEKCQYRFGTEKWIEVTEL